MPFYRHFGQVLCAVFKFSGQQYSKILNISRRTLQDYRTEGKIPYYLVGGKILYKESDIEKLLTENYYSKPDGF
jgi:excisionase family DNA binding protein